MTIALVVNIREGAILASDSASTLVGADGRALNVYNNANKVFNLYKGKSFGVATYGAGSIGPYPIGLLAKEFREKLTNRSLPFQADNYSLRDVAEQFRAYIFDEHYEPEFGALPADEKPALGFILTGYSAAELLPETYVIETDENGTAQIEKQFEKTNFGMVAKGQPEAVDRLYWGFQRDLVMKLGAALSLDEEAFTALLDLFFSHSRPMVTPAMPLQDAIDFAHFMVDTAIKYQRFLLDDKTVGGPIEIATMTKYEGFKWIHRKHYYRAELNPRE